MASGGSLEEAWFDSIPVFESDCEEEYESVQDGIIFPRCLNSIAHFLFATPFSNLRFGMHAISADAFSVNGFEGASEPSISSLRDTSNWHCYVNVQHTSAMGDSQLKPDGLSSDANRPVYLDEISLSVDENGDREEGMLENCGILPNNCLPCLASTMSSDEKRRSLSSSPPSARKKAALKISFKWRDGNANASLCK